MAYDEYLAERIRSCFSDRPDIQEKKMFGGVGFLLNEHLCSGILADKLVVRLGKDAYFAALEEPHTGEFEPTGRPMTGWVLVEPEGFDTEDQLNRWLQRAVEFTATLPPKK